MYFNKKIKYLGAILLGCITLSTNSKTTQGTAISIQLNWITAPYLFCQGYYLDPPFTKAFYRKDNRIEITGNQGLFSFRNTSEAKGKIIIARTGQQINANELKLFRNSKDGKLNKLLLSGNVILREPGTLIKASKAQIDLTKKTELMQNVLYRISLNIKKLKKTNKTKQQKIAAGCTAFGYTKFFQKTSLNIVNLYDATYSTCAPILPPAWQLKAKHIHLDKKAGRGIAKKVKLQIHGISLLYLPWISFPLDTKRKSGLLRPAIGTSGKSGAWLRMPIYLNLAPNYDATITPEILSKRGINLETLFRYLTPKSNGTISIDVLPNDRAFKKFKKQSFKQFNNNPNPVIQSELRRLKTASNIRYAIKLRNETHYNSHWYSKINYNRVSDDYYLRDLTNNLNEITDNQLLQQANLNYDSNHWHITTKLQGYQALHPLNEVVTVDNQYAKLPQISATGNYPITNENLNFKILTEFTRFALQPSPGSQTTLPTGNRLYLQPGISNRWEKSWFYLEPRLQYSMIQYKLNKTTTALNNKTNLSRYLPLFDTKAGLYLERNFNLHNHMWQQTLTPEIYYVYIPFRNQTTLPLFDTSDSTLSFDQLFSINRFNGIDRIGDTNQLTIGVTTEIKDKQTSINRLSASIGQIIYFSPLRTNLNPNLTTNSTISPIAGRISWDINSAWKLNADSIWDIKTNQFENQTISISYKPFKKAVINLSYTFIRQGDVQIGDDPNSPDSNLMQTNLAFQWPVTKNLNTVGRWTHNWNHHHFQNLLYGLEYDTCCWAIRFVAVRAFTGLNATGNSFMYENSFSLQFALKGLGTIGNNDPKQLLNNSISGYQSNFGQNII